MGTISDRFAAVNNLMQSSDALVDALAEALENPPTDAADLAVLALGLTLLIDEPEAARLAISVRSGSRPGLHHTLRRIVADRDHDDPATTLATIADEAVVAGVDLEGLAA